MDRLNSFMEWVAQIPKRYIGICAGIFVWIILELFGFFPTLLLAVFVTIGYAIGKMADQRHDWLGIIERIWQSDHYDP